MDLHKLIDLALATPQIGVINLSILKSLLHILVQQLKLDTCKIEFDGDFALQIESLRSNSAEPTLRIKEYTSDGNLITEFERPAYTIKAERSDPDPIDVKPEFKPFKTSTAPLASFDRNSAATTSTAIKIENSQCYESIDDFKCTNETAINVKTLEEIFIEPSAGATETIDVIQTKTSCSIRRKLSPNEIVESLVDDIVFTATSGHTSARQHSQRSSCVKRVLNEILINVYNAEQLFPDALPAITKVDDPFIRRSEIVEIIERVIANRLPPDDAICRMEVYDNIQKLLDDSQLIDNKTVTYDIRQYFERNVQHLCDKLERYIHSKIEMENDSVNGEQLKPITFADAQLQTDPAPAKRSCTQNANKGIAKQPISFSSRQPKRFCGGLHTLTTPSSRLMRKGNFKDQYIDLMAQHIKDKLERKKKPPTDAFRNNSSDYYYLNVCNCDLDASSGFIICGTASRRKFE